MRAIVDSFLDFKTEPTAGKSLLCCIDPHSTNLSLPPVAFGVCCHKTSEKPVLSLKVPQVSRQRFSILLTVLPDRIVFHKGSFKIIMRSFAAFLVSLGWLILKTQALGGELALYDTPPLTPDISHRQDVCSRYDQFRSGEIELRYALDGMALRPILRLNEFFHYDKETGIDPDDPGLMATLLDEVASRAGFTWRDSFAILERPSEPVINNITWTFTDLLAWSVDSYDVAINWWDQSVERMERGVAYMEPWFDGSVILIDKEDPVEEKDRINIFNWLRPFTPNVWILTIATVILSGICHQYLEWINGDRNGRSHWQWFSDNFYLSWMNITQNYEYAPNSFSGRLFGISLGIWALVMTATYTANLASLLVEAKGQPFAVESIEQAIVLQIPICTYGNTNADVIIKRRYENAIRVPFESELEAYEALRRGECGLVASYLDNWLGYQQDARYNPDCDLKWVGRTVETIKSGFAAKADAGHQCTSLIRDVINLHMTELISDNILDEAWERHRSKISQENAIECAVDDVDEESNTRRLAQIPALRTSSRGRSQQQVPRSQARHRKLKGGGNSAAANGSEAEGERLTVEQMAGVFILHFIMMIISVGISLVDNYLLKRRNKGKSKSSHPPSESRRVSFRDHGPIVGTPPPINTYLQDTKTNHKQLAVGDFTGTTVRTDFAEQSDALSGSSSEGEAHPLASQLHAAVQATQVALKDSHSELLLRHNELAEQMKMMMRMMTNNMQQPSSSTGNDLTGAYAVDYDLALSAGATSDEKKSHME